MEQKIIDRAKWLYAYNGGARTKEDCAKQAVNEQNMAELLRELGLFELEYNDLCVYADYIAMCF